MLHDTDPVRRHPDGAIDVDFYAARALQDRRAARVDAMFGLRRLFRDRLSALASSLHEAPRRLAGADRP